MLTCSRCGGENRPEALYCRHCGAALGAACPACGSPNLRDAAFCDRCGAALPGPNAGAGPAPAAKPGKLQAPPKGEIEGIRLAYTPRHLRAVVGPGGDIRGERKEVVVLFADVSGFTRLSEEIDPEEVHRIMNGGFEILTAEVHRFGGTVNQYTGDGVMALFGAPRALEGAPRDSIRAAVHIQERFKEFASQLEAERGIRFQVRIGLNAGEVVVGSIGDDLRMDYTAMGDTTNVAARLQADAAPGEIHVSESLFRLTREWFRFEDRGERLFKGKSKPIRVYRVLGRGKVSTRIEAAALRGLTRLREREEALGALLHLYGEVREGRGQIVAITGEAGIGKSRIVYELKEALKRGEAEPPLCLAASATHYDRYAPLSLLRRILKAYAQAVAVYCPINPGGEDGFWQDVILTRASQLLPGAGDIPPIQRILRRDGGEGAGAADVHRGLEAVLGLFIQEARERPVVLAVDNMRDAESSSVEFLDLLASRLSAERILFIPIHRPGFENPWASRRNFHQIALGPLSPQAGEDMCREILGQPASPELLEVVLSRAQGNPFFIEELVRGMRDSGAIVSGNGQMRLAAAGDAISFPRTIQDVLLARLDALPRHLRELLQAAAVIGPRFDSELLARVLEDAPDLEARLADLQEMEIIYASEGGTRGEWRFSNRMLQEMAYREMLWGQRALLHEKAGTAIEAQGPAAVEENLDRLASHFQRSENLRKAAHYLIRAGRRAYAFLAFPLAASRLEQGLIFMETLEEKETEPILAERIRVRGALALALLALGTGEERVETLLSEMREMAGRAGDLTQLAMADIHLCTLRFRQGNQPAVVEAASRAIATAERAGAWEPKFRGRAALASAYRLMARNRQSVEESEEAIRIYEERLGDRERQSLELIHVYVEALATLGATHALMGEAGRAGECFARARGAASTIHLMGLVRFFENSLLAAQGRWRESEASMSALLDEFAKFKFPFARAAIAVWLGRAKIHLGQVEEGLRLVEEATQERQRIGQHLLISMNHIVRAEGLWRLGRREDAFAALHEAREAARSAGEESARLLARELEARIRCEAAPPGELRARAEEYAEALEELDRSGFRPAAMRGRLRLAAALEEMGEAGRARRMEGEARAFLRSAGAQDAEAAPGGPAGEGQGAASLGSDDAPHRVP